MRKGKQPEKRRMISQDMDPDEAIHQLLDDNQQITSHGPSQYQEGGVSACGLASLNCARIILTAEQNGLRGKDLLRFVLAPSTAEEITSICTKWSSKSHLEVEDIFCVPLFSKSLTLVTSKFAHPSFEEFKKLLLELKTTTPTETSAAVVITRPPEIITCIKIATSSADVFLIFDSHPRPTHPDGAGFTLNTSIDDTANQLANLLEVDTRILADNSDMQWQLQLLTNFSGHIFISKPQGDDVTELTQTVLESSMTILALRAEVTDLKYQNSCLVKSNRRLEAKFATAKYYYDLRKLESTLQESRDSGRSARNTNDHFAHPPSVSTSQVRSGLRHGHDTNNLRSPPREAMVYYSGEPVPPSKSKSPISHPYMDTNTFTEENDDFAYARLLQSEWEDSQDPDARVARQKQREFEEENLRLEAERMELAVSAVQVTFKCTVCLEEHAEDDAAKISACNHTFCRDCLRGYIISKLSEHRYPILCPVCVMTAQSKEPGMITDSLVQELGVPEETYQILQELQLSAFSILLHCRRCEQSVFVDRSEYQESRIIVCPLPGCNYVWCKMCQQEISTGRVNHSCDGSSELEDLMKTQGWKHCPGCTTPIQKDSGCHHMTCMTPGCNTHFCYHCGESIIKSALGKEIKAAVSAHYNRQCKLFDVPR